MIVLENPETAKNRGANPLNLLTHKTHTDAGGPSYANTIITAEKTGSQTRLAHTDGSRYQYHRTIALMTSMEQPNPQDQKKRAWA